MKKRAFSSTTTKDQPKPTTSTKHQRKNVAASASTNEIQESWKHYFEDGRQAFTASQYKEALQYFTQALRLQPTNLTLLDSRSATYDRLQQWDAAVKDAKMMIKIAPQVSKGYLRLGKLVTSQPQQQNEKTYRQAALVYRRGCSKVDEGDPRYALLTTLASDMESKVNADKRRIQGQRDPLHILPYDVLDLIFTYLPFHRRVACTQVSSDWNRFLRHWPGMWRQLDFITGATKHDVVSRKTLTSYFSYTRGRHIRSFSLSASKPKTDYALQLLIDQDCQYLEYLGFSNSGFSLNLFSRTLRLMGKQLTHLYLDNCDTPLEPIFTQLSAICPQLTHLYYGSELKTEFITTMDAQHTLPRLQQLHLVSNASQSTLDVILAQCPNLTHLVLPRIYVSVATLLLRHPLPHLRVYYHDACSTMSKQSLWESALTTTTIPPPPTPGKVGGWVAFSAMGTTLDDHTLNSIVTTHRTTLEIINLNQTVGFSNQWCSLLLPPPALPLPLENEGEANPSGFISPLVELSLNQCTRLDDTDLCRVISACPRLQVVGLAYVCSVTNTTLEHLAQLPHLKRLDLTACPQITGSGLRRLVDLRRHTLKKLLLNDCAAIQPDAIQHARSVLGRTAVECTFGKR
ncbi:hypothetical protein BCR42DRAFT_410394 [Absidia repens]|uniref:F-box domain-containing protein n=1 Tax=Absidia repens TaxID=90262 RepID=A0A1X2IP10_9FUNG|nr:hypothetical protein BCR42DRAFT_410394 [Absidia repens]